MIREPRYSGLRVKAYGPPRASRFPLSMWPAAQMRSAAPASARIPPAHMERSVGRMTKIKTIANNKPVGTRIFCAFFPHSCRVMDSSSEITPQHFGHIFRGMARAQQVANLRQLGFHPRAFLRLLQ